ncbi:ABC-type multidrug transport system ATPase subunit [Actinokineospora baliensis]|uniref:ABC transporter ATP-binding protein n=1 Tax=Actinokineospora baliensis TaxID=547056 RepID=UPI0027DC6979|nr:ATP-binding cassette domain-containing protein [Actinokineospora baliensis]MBM7770827.1 ABC-type multidrug transport system ATPase subunit [Actinokineospora baliensis]
MPDEIISAAGVGVLVGEQRWLFRDLDLAVPGGGCLALTGDNGSGKSTLLRCLYGLQDPTEGAVTVAGRAPDESDTGFRREVSVLLDDSALFDEFTPAQHFDLLGVAEPDHGLPDVPARGLSAGQRRRLLLLGAFTKPHRVLLLDEPERAVDAAGRTWLAGMIKEAKAAGAAVVLASHFPPLVDAVADQVIHL